MHKSRREFFKNASVTGIAAMTIPFAGNAFPENLDISQSEIEDKLIVPKAKGLKITGTFLDEISHDIPHQNWGEKEWDQDFAHMKAIGIDTVIMIRSGYRKFITYSSKYLLGQGCYKPSVDLLDM